MKKVWSGVHYISKCGRGAVSHENSVKRDRKESGENVILLQSQSNGSEEAIIGAMGETEVNSKDR